MLLISLSLTSCFDAASPLFSCWILSRCLNSHPAISTSSNACYSCYTFLTPALNNWLVTVCRSPLHIQKSLICYLVADFYFREMLHVKKWSKNFQRHLVLGLCWQEEMWEGSPEPTAFLMGLRSTVLPWSGKGRGWETLLRAVKQPFFLFVANCK